MTWGCSPITALLTSMRSAPPIMGQTRQCKKKSPARPKARAGCGAPLGSARQWIKRTSAPGLRRDADDVVIRFAGILEIAGAQFKPASFWSVSLTDRVYVAAGGRPR